MTLIFLLLSVSIGESAVSNSDLLVPTNPSLWVEDEQHKVSVGVELFVIEMTLEDICHAKKIENEADSPYNLTRTAYGNLYNLCSKHFNDTVKPAFQRLASCRTDQVRGKSHALDRYKRFDPITIGFIALTCWVIATTTAGTVKLVEHSNRLAAVENLSNTIKNTANNIVEDLEKAKMLRDSIIEQNNATRKETESNKEAILYTANLLPRMSWDSAMLVTDLKDAQTYYDRLAMSCQNNQVDAHALVHFSKRPELNHIETDGTEIIDVRRSNETTIYLTFKHFIKPNDTAIYRSASVDHWRDALGERKYVRYDGPKLMIYNSTSNCSAGIDEPKISYSYISCPEPNYTDPRLLQWVQIKPEIETPLQIMQVGSQVIAQCFGGNVSLNGETFVCPSYVWSVPFNTQVVMSNLTHHVRSRRITFRNNIAKTPALGWEHNFSNYQEFLEKLNQTKMANQASVKTVKIDIIDIPTGFMGSMLSKEILMILGAVLFIMLIFVMAMCCGRRAGDTRSGQNISNNIIIQDPMIAGVIRPGLLKASAPPPSDERFEASHYMGARIELSRDLAEMRSCNQTNGRRLPALTYPSAENPRNSDEDERPKQTSYSADSELETDVDVESDY